MITMVLEFQMKLNNIRDEGKGINKERKKKDEKHKRKYFYRKQYRSNDNFLP